MASLLDIAPLTETVSVGGKDVEVYGLAADGIVHLLARFPELRKLMTGVEVTPERLMEMGGEAVAALIAWGCVPPDDGSPERYGQDAAIAKRMEAVARRLGAEAQIDFLGKILKLTLPNGVGPFVEKLTALGATLGGEVAALAKAPATKSRK